MSTLDVTCARCAKKFRVRAEFAGRSTRCPGCSAPITIGDGPRPAAPLKAAAEDRAPQRRRPVEDDEDEPRRPTANWRPVDAAFRREQLAVVFALLGIFGSFFSFCLTNVNRHSGDMEPIVVLVVLLFGIGPALATAAFGVMARISALGAPVESLTRGSAMASMLCGLTALACLLVFSLTLLASIGSHEADPLPMIVALGGLVLSGLGALVTFFGFIAQVGMARRSTGVCRAVGRLSITITACVLSLLGIGFLYTVGRELAGPDYSGYRPDHSGFFQFVLGILLPLALGVVLILYHRLLTAGRRAAVGEVGRRYED